MFPSTITFSKKFVHVRFSTQVLTNFHLGFSCAVRRIYCNHEHSVYRSFSPWYKSIKHRASMSDAAAYVSVTMETWKERSELKTSKQTIQRRLVTKARSRDNCFVTIYTFCAGSRGEYDEIFKLARQGVVLRRNQSWLEEMSEWSKPN